MAGYGPHEPEVLRLFEHAARLAPERLPELFLIASREETPAAMTGHRQIGRLRTEPAFGAWLAEAERAARLWAGELRTDHMLPMGGYEMGSGIDAGTRSLAMRTLFEAAAALIARDRLSDEEFDALFGPWDFVINARPVPGERPGA